MAKYIVDNNGQYIILPDELADFSSLRLQFTNEFKDFYDINPEESGLWMDVTDPKFWYLKGYYWPPGSIPGMAWDSTNRKYVVPGPYYGTNCSFRFETKSDPFKGIPVYALRFTGENIPASNQHDKILYFVPAGNEYTYNDINKLIGGYWYDGAVISLNNPTMSSTITKIEVLVSPYKISKNWTIKWEKEVPLGGLGFTLDGASSPLVVDNTLYIVLTSSSYTGYFCSYDGTTLTSEALTISYPILYRFGSSFAYIVSSSSLITFYRRTGTNSWQSETVTDPIQLWDYTCKTLSDGRFVILGNDSDNNKIYLWTRSTGGTWSRETVWDVGHYYYNLDFNIFEDQYGKLHLCGRSYYNWEDTTIWHISNETSSWVRTAIDIFTDGGGQATFYYENSSGKLCALFVGEDNKTYRAVRDVSWSLTAFTDRQFSFNPNSGYYSIFYKDGYIYYLMKISDMPILWTVNESNLSVTREYPTGFRTWLEMLGWENYDSANEKLIIAEFDPGYGSNESGPFLHVYERDFS
jgi:hypothetical protein